MSVESEALRGRLGRRASHAASEPGVGSDRGDGTVGTVRTVAVLALSVLLSASPGCEFGLDRVDLTQVRQSHAGLAEHYKRYPLTPTREEEQTAVREQPGVESAILGELLAIFPGVLVHGLGHYYAGDTKTARKLTRLGGVGYLCSAVAAGLVAGGYFLDEADEEDDWDGYVYSLYTGGSIFGLIGVGYILSAWIYDMVDTPRAVLSGGKPPPRSAFVDSLDLFE